MIVGTATLRIVLSSTMMNSALDSTTRAIHRFGSGRWLSITGALLVFWAPSVTTVVRLGTQIAGWHESRPDCQAAAAVSA